MRLTGEPDQSRLISILGPCTGAAPTCEITLDGRRAVDYRFADTSGGAVEWSRAIGSATSMVEVMAISHGTGDRAWVAGTGFGQYSLGGPEQGSNATTAYVPFVVQYGEDDGGYVVERRFPTVGYAAPSSVVTMPTGGLVFAARYNSTLDLGGEVAERAVGCAGGMALARYDEALNRVWSNGFGNASCGAPVAGLDSVGGIILSGWLLDRMDFGGGFIGGARVQRLFAAGFDADGGFSQAFDVPTMSTTTAAASAVVGLPDGGIVLGGSFLGQFPLGGVPLDSQGIISGFLVAYTPAGQELWSRPLGVATGGALVSSMALDPGGDLYVLGEFSGTLALEGSSVTSRGDVDVFVARFTGSGDLIWLTSFGGPGLERGGSIAITAKGVAVSGSYSPELQVAAQTLTAAGSEDVFVIGLSREGEVRWARSFGSSGVDRAGGLSSTGDGGLLLAGRFDGVTVNGTGFSIPDAGPRTTAPIRAVRKGAVLLRLWP
ncbi:MAG: hypothetical protein Q8L48_00640 [Archangium sp.]|nr:hypothetical protein [Archangium sp.]